MGPARRRGGRSARRRAGIDPRADVADLGRAERERPDRRSFPRRGLRRIDPPTLVVSDALELARVVRVSASPPQELLVLPRTERVQWVPGRGGEVAPRDRRGPVEPFGATEIDGLRPYRQGTPASRIHWAALARGAGLLERRLRADTETRPLVVARRPRLTARLDTSRRRGQGRRLARARVRDPHRLRPAAPRRVPSARDRAGSDRVAGRARASSR